ncbi:CTSS [Cordylochernes scorpioides]|uniref:CTSS n=1 Tax=Cordylochernes scorpioides TaxID=51811 RepID=A0ABY6JXD2_9ARAC|nr:CTSS [Cordylochernes scorpioides]
MSGWLKVSLLILLVVGYVSSVPLTRSSDAMWEAFKDKYGKHYETEEDARRRDIWEANVRLINEHNYYADLKNDSVRMGVNAHTDKLLEEITGLDSVKLSANSTKLTYQRQVNVQLPEELDLRMTGHVTPVRSQGHCKSCWAFSAIGALEGQLKVKTGSIVPLSPEQLLDCVYESYCHHLPSGIRGSMLLADGLGCERGGLPSTAFNYIHRAGGLEKDSDYPYHDIGDHTCHFDKSKSVLKVKDYVELPEGDEEVLKEALATVGPISVAIAANHGIHLYKSGVYRGSCNHRLNHAVLAVGYGEQDGVPYWLIKNSWGEQWGEEGYMRLYRGDNHCLVADLGTYPLLED